MRELTREEKHGFCLNTLWDIAEQPAYDENFKRLKDVFTWCDRTKAIDSIRDYLSHYGIDDPEDYFFGEFVCLVAGTISIDQLLDVRERPRLENGKYPFVYGSSETTVYKYRQAQKNNMDCFDLYGELEKKRKEHNDEDQLDS